MIRGLLVLTLMLPVTALAKEPTPHGLSEADSQKGDHRRVDQRLSRQLSVPVQ